MKPRALPSSPTASQALSASGAAAIATAALVALTLATAAVVASVPGLAAATRDFVSVSLDGLPHTPGQAASIAANNVLIAASMLLVAALAPHMRRGARFLCDALVVSIVARSGLLVGAVLGTTGTDLLPFLVHLPLEWAGVGMAAGAWLRARRVPLTARELLSLAGLSVVLLSIAAVIETYATPR